MAKKYTITDVAADLGVSCSTVSRALSNSPGVGEEVRNKIIAYAREIGYEPNRKTHQKDAENCIVGLVLGDIRNPFYGELAFHIQRMLNEKGYMVMVFNTEYSVDKEIEFLHLLRQYRFAGLIMMTTQVEKVNTELERLEIPVVLVNRNINSFQGDLVLLDNFKAGYVAAMHLIELGHERIGFVKGHTSSSASRQRFEGYSQAMRNYGLEIREEDIFYSEMKMESGEQIAEQFIKKKNRPSGMVVINDVTALGFVAICKRAGIKIPEELSVVSFDNTKFAEWGEIPLTSVDQSAREMGEQTVEVLTSRMKSGQRESQRVILNPQLVVRQSTARYQKEQG